MVRAAIVDPVAPGHLQIGEVEEPRPNADEALIRVRAISLNRGEVRRAQASQPGARLGWDIAGIVEQAAADGSGPKAGERVVGILRTGAWAELLAVPTANLAVLPENVSFEQASTLPVAGLTALYALDRAAGLTGRNVLVTGASGGVGHLAIQIARHGGCSGVTGLVRQERHLAAAREAGATSVYADETGAAARESGPYDVALESVAGEVLVNVLGMMRPHGLVVVYGTSAGGQVTLDSGIFSRSRVTVSPLLVFTEMQKEGAGVGLSRLVRLVSEGALRPHIAVEAPWTDIGRLAQQLIDREFPGKAVLHVE